MVVKSSNESDQAQAAFAFHKSGELSSDLEYRARDLPAWRRPLSTRLTGRFSQLP